MLVRRVVLEIRGGFAIPKGKQKREGEKERERRDSERGSGRAPERPGAHKGYRNGA